ncbi:type IX secretion system anionic LPS delivery protein PorZ [Olleya aquimaris]|nr:two-component regulator propeller domain-containing protein [Olleya aquimaris]
MRIKKDILKILILILSFSSSIKVLAQDFSDAWTGHFSYLDVRDIYQGTTKIFCAAENAIFIYDKNTNQIETLSTINGLSGETLTTVSYQEELGLIFMGFENGLIQIYDEAEQSILSVVDIIEKPTIAPNNKRINHLNIVEYTLYISTDYGISIYNIDRLEFGDTYFIGPNGSQINITQSTILDDYIYASTPNGVKRGLLSNPNLIDYQEWDQFLAGNWVGIVAINQSLFIARSNKTVYEYVNNTLQLKATYQDFVNDIRVDNGKVIVTTEREAYVYNPVGFTTIAQVVNTELYDVKYTCATVDEFDDIFVGTFGVTIDGKRGFGILKTNALDTSIFEEIHPDSPLLNKFFKVNTLGGHIYGVHGGYSIDYNPYSGEVFRRTGVSHYFDEAWQNIPYDSIQPLAAYPWSLSHISINPNNPNLAYISSSVGGLLEVDNNEATIVYDGTNSTLIPFFGLNHFVHASTYDSDGSLWVMNSRYEAPLNRFKDGQWTSFDFLELINPATSNNGFSNIIVDENDNIFLGSYNYGIVGFNENGGNYIFQNIAGEENDMPANNVRGMALDKNGQLWLGTDKGLRVIYNTQEFMNGTGEVDNIVVLDDGIARELLFQQYITDIEVDGANNKWIATLDTGLYYFSSDGQETIFHFTTDNSPLPTNDILDVDIDNVNGIIYIATEKGLVSFKSDSSKPKDNLQNAFVFPNPVRPGFDIVSEKVKIRDISDNVNIKIVDIEGNLVAEAESRTNSRFKGYNLEIDGGTALWNGKNLGGNIVASGVYLIMLNDLDTFETKVLKVMVVR